LGRRHRNLECSWRKGKAVLDEGKEEQNGPDAEEDFS
jgi:hypothetical protein